LVQPLLIDVDTIAAVATAAGRGGIGVVRVSGPKLNLFIHQLLGLDLTPREARLCSVYDETGQLIDQGLALFFPAPHSYTGEDVLEFQGHGGPVVVNAVLRRCLQLGARLARPGEFTQRAFLNDKLDLAQAESVADLIDASSIEAARCAARSLRGEFSQKIHDLVASLTSLRAQIETLLDFSDEALEFMQSERISDKLAQLVEQLHAVDRAAQRGSLLREGIHLVLIGQPNVGKSSLLNRLAGDERAIVTEIAGTTRDLIRETVLLQGVPVHVIDTAGLRDTDDIVERAGIERTWQAIAQANIALLMVDAQNGITEEEESILSRLPDTLTTLVVHNKIDLLGTPATSATNHHSISAKSGAGLTELTEHILALAGWSTQSNGIFMARERHLQALHQAIAHITAAQQQEEVLELMAEELRCAQQVLGDITGPVDADSLLGVIFSEFCIGK
jgi:tRNA modification GTPase